ncbi:MAG: hypothetical protein HY331_09175 [Chloroflexi bacterium]|nr:hypothetical protein [Chloroflexota bacterium]
MPPHEFFRTLPTPLPGGPERPATGTFSATESQYITPTGIIRSVAIIAIGTVEEVQAARWSTPDGKRPDFRAMGLDRSAIGDWDSGTAIITPVVLHVEEYLKGAQPADRLILRTYGGRVGQDALGVNWPTMEILRVPGQRVIVYLTQPKEGPFWRPVQALGLKPDGTTVPRYGVSVKEDEIRKAISHALAQ